MNQIELIEVLEASMRRCNSETKTSMIGVTGYPYCGKTSICLTLVDRQPDIFAHVPMESYILNRENRTAAGLDGCACEAHSLNKTEEDMQNLMSGADISLSEYSWESGGRTGKRHLVSHKKVLYLFDGSAVSCPPVADFVERFFFFIPRKTQEWLELASLRDARERNWSMKDAMKLNKRKIDTCVDQHHYLTQREDLRARLTVIPFEVQINLGEQEFSYTLDSEP